MKNTILLLLALLCSSTFLIAQQDNKNQEWEKELEEAMEKVSEAIKNIEIPQIDMDSVMADIDFDAIMEDAKANMPTQEEMEMHRRKWTEAMAELEEVDMTRFEEAMKRMEAELKEIDLSEVEEKMEKMKEEWQEIDMHEFEEAMQKMREELKQLFEDHEFEFNSSKGRQI